MAQSGSASALGAEGRGFESLCPDHYGQWLPACAPVAQWIEHRPSTRSLQRETNRCSGPHCNGEPLTDRADGNPVETGRASRRTGSVETIRAAPETVKR